MVLEQNKNAVTHQSMLSPSLDGPQAADAEAVMIDDPQAADTVALATVSIRERPLEDDAPKGSTTLYEILPVSEILEQTLPVTIMNGDGVVADDADKEITIESSILKETLDEKNNESLVNSQLLQGEHSFAQEETKDLALPLKKQQANDLLESNVEPGQVAESEHAVVTAPIEFAANSLSESTLNEPIDQKQTIDKSHDSKLINAVDFKAGTETELSSDVLHDILSSFAVEPKSPDCEKITLDDGADATPQPQACKSFVGERAAWLAAKPFASNSGQPPPIRSTTCTPVSRSGVQERAAWLAAKPFYNSNKVPEEKQHREKEKVTADVKSKIEWLKERAEKAPPPLPQQPNAQQRKHLPQSSSISGCCRPSFTAEEAKISLTTEEGDEKFTNVKKRIEWLSEAFVDQTPITPNGNSHLFPQKQSASALIIEESQNHVVKERIEWLKHLAEKHTPSSKKFGDASPTLKQSDVAVKRRIEWLQQLAGLAASSASRSDTAPKDTCEDNVDTDGLVHKGISAQSFDLFFHRNTEDGSALAVVQERIAWLKALEKEAAAAAAAAKAVAKSPRKRVSEKLGTLPTLAILDEEANLNHEDAIAAQERIEWLQELIRSEELQSTGDSAVDRSEELQSTGDLAVEMPTETETGTAAAVTTANAAGLPIVTTIESKFLENTLSSVKKQSADDISLSVEYAVPASASTDENGIGVSLNVVTEEGNDQIRLDWLKAFTEPTPPAQHHHSMWEHSSTLPQSVTTSSIIARQEPLLSDSKLSVDSTDSHVVVEQVASPGTEWINKSFTDGTEAVQNQALKDGIKRSENEIEQLPNSTEANLSPTKRCDAHKARGLGNFGSFIASTETGQEVHDFCVDDDYVFVSKEGSEIMDNIHVSKFDEAKAQMAFLENIDSAVVAPSCDDKKFAENKYITSSKQDNDIKSNVVAANFETLDDPVIKVSSKKKIAVNVQYENVISDSRNNTPVENFEVSLAESFEPNDTVQLSVALVEEKTTTCTGITEVRAEVSDLKNISIDAQCLEIDQLAAEKDTNQSCSLLDVSKDENFKKGKFLAFGRLSDCNSHGTSTANQAYDPSLTDVNSSSEECQIIHIDSTEEFATTGVSESYTKDFLEAKLPSETIANQDDDQLYNAFDNASNHGSKMLDSPSANNDGLKHSEMSVVSLASIDSLTSKNSNFSNTDFATIPLFESISESKNDDVTHAAIVSCNEKLEPTRNLPTLSNIVNANKLDKLDNSNCAIIAETKMVRTAETSTTSASTLSLVAAGSNSTLQVVGTSTVDRSSSEQSPNSDKSGNCLLPNLIEEPNAINVDTEAVSDQKAVTQEIDSDSIPKSMSSDVSNHSVVSNDIFKSFELDRINKVIIGGTTSTTLEAKTQEEDSAFATSSDMDLTTRNSSVNIVKGSDSFAKNRNLVAKGDNNSVKPSLLLAVKDATDSAEKVQNGNDVIANDWPANDKGIEITTSVAIQPKEDVQESFFETSLSDHNIAGNSNASIATPDSHAVGSDNVTDFVTFPTLSNLLTQRPVLDGSSLTTKTGISVRSSSPSDKSLIQRSPSHVNIGSNASTRESYASIAAKHMEMAIVVRPIASSSFLRATSNYMTTKSQSLLSTKVVQNDTVSSVEPKTIVKNLAPTKEINVETSLQPVVKSVNMPTSTVAKSRSLKSKKNASVTVAPKKSVSTMKKTSLAESSTVLNSNIRSADKSNNDMLLNEKTAFKKLGSTLQAHNGTVQPSLFVQNPKEILFQKDNILLLPNGKNGEKSRSTIQNDIIPSGFVEKETSKSNKKARVSRNIRSKKHRMRSNLNLSKVSNQGDNKIFTDLATNSQLSHVARIIVVTALVVIPCYLAWYTWNISISSEL